MEKIKIPVISEEVNFGDSDEMSFRRYQAVRSFHLIAEMPPMTPPNPKIAPTIA